MPGDRKETTLDLWLKNSNWRRERHSVVSLFFFASVFAGLGARWANRRGIYTAMSRASHRLIILRK